MAVIINEIPKYSRMTPEQRQKRREKTQEVATGVGAAGVTAQATSYASKKGVYGQFKGLLGATSKTAKTLERNSVEVTGLWNKFFKNMREFSAEAMAWVSKFKDMKFIGPIVKSPVMKGAASLFGTTMAFFVLVSGVQKAVDNGRIAIGDFHNRFDHAA